jgi:hypothetical protein
MIEALFYPLEMAVLHHTRLAAVLALIGAARVVEWIVEVVIM